MHENKKTDLDFGVREVSNWIDLGIPCRNVMVRGQINGNQLKSMEIQSNLLISIEIHDSCARNFGILWRPVAPCGGPLDATKKPLQDGTHEITDHQLLGSSDDQILEIISGQISEHQLFGLAARG